MMTLSPAQIWRLLTQARRTYPLFYHIVVSDRLMYRYRWRLYLRMRHSVRALRRFDLYHAAKTCNRKRRYL